MVIYFLKLGKFTAIILQILFLPLVLSFWDSYDVHVDLLVVVVSKDPLAQLTFLHSFFLSAPHAGFKLFFLLDSTLALLL